MNWMLYMAAKSHVKVLFYAFGHPNMWTILGISHLCIFLGGDFSILGNLSPVLVLMNSAL